MSIHLSDPKRLLAPLAVAAVAAGSLTIPSSATAARSCGSMPVTIGSQKSKVKSIKASRVSCAKARSVVRATVKGKANGWKLTRGGSGVKLTRAGATVTFDLVCVSRCGRPKGH